MIVARSSEQAAAQPDFELAAFSCPLINPPSQQGLFANKIHNIELAISKIARVLGPREEFSFWRRVGEPTAENGYREGAMFRNHRVTTDVGGGLCQLSGLIYNLAILSGCEILERFHHSIDAYGEERYIPLGRDATVAYGFKDLRFMNPHAFPLNLDLHVDTQHAWGAVRASRPLRGRIEIAVELLETIPPQIEEVTDSRLMPGDETVDAGLSGKSVVVWRITSGEDDRPRRQVLSRDHYAATPTVIRRGIHSG